MNINERGNFISPNDINPTDVKKLTAQDDEIFHKARLVNCGFFVRVILGDYVGAILGLVRDGSSWRLDPLQVSVFFTLTTISPNSSITRDD